MRRDTSHLLHERYTLGPGHSCSTFVIREIDSHDIKQAARLAQARVHKSMNDLERQAVYLEEQIRASLVEVDGVVVNIEVPYSTADWKKKTTDFLGLCWMRLNTLPDEEIESLQGQAVDPPTAVLVRKEG